MSRVTGVLVGSEDGAGGPLDAEIPFLALLAAMAAAVLYVYGRRWWDTRRDRRTIPEKWWPIGLEPGGGQGESTPDRAGVSGASSPSPSPSPSSLPRELAAHELSFLAGNRSDTHLIALGFVELAARRLVRVSRDMDFVSLTAQAPPPDLPPLLERIYAAVPRPSEPPSGRFDAFNPLRSAPSSGASASQIGTDLAGGFWRDSSTVLGWVGAPLVAFGLVDVREVDAGEYTELRWVLRPAGRAVVESATRIAAGVDPGQLADLARTDPVSALGALTRLPAPLLVLMRPLHPIARDVVAAVQPHGYDDQSVDGIYLADLHEPEVVLGRTDDYGGTDDYG